MEKSFLLFVPTSAWLMMRVFMSVFLFACGATVRKKTGLSDNKMQGIVYNLKKQGKIKSERKVYVKA